MKLRKFSPREQKALGAMVAVGSVTVYVYFAFLVGPLWQKAVDLGQRVRTSREELQTLRAATANEGAIREQYQALQTTVGSLRSFLPPEKDLPAVIEVLSNLAQRTNVKIQTIFPQRSLADQQAVTTAKNNPAAIPEPVVYRQVPIQIDAQSGFHQLGLFLSMVEAEATPMELRSLRVASDPREPKRHTVKMVIDAYFAADSAIGQP